MSRVQLVVAMFCLSVGGAISASGQSEERESNSFFIDTQQISAARLYLGVTNPLTKYHVLNLQDDFSLLEGELPGIDDEWTNVFQISPTIPIDLGFGGLHLVNQFVFPLFTVREPIVFSDPGAPGGFGVDYAEATAFGDVLMTNYLAHTAENGRILGFGPSFSFPTATDDIPEVRTEKYTVGPAALFGFLPEFGSVWTYAAVQHLWSVGGDSDRPDVSRTALQYFYQFNFYGTGGKNGFWSFGASPIITADWEKDGGDVWSVPIGTGVLYTGKIAGDVWARMGAQVDYHVARPDTAGREWNFRVFFSPMLPVDFQKGIAAIF